jgi:hypothetical protein
LAVDDERAKESKEKRSVKAIRYTKRIEKNRLTRFAEPRWPDENGFSGVLSLAQSADIQRESNARELECWWIRARRCSGFAIRGEFDGGGTGLVSMTAGEEGVVGDRYESGVIGKDLERRVREKDLRGNENLQQKETFVDGDHVASTAGRVLHR